MIGCPTICVPLAWKLINTRIELLIQQEHCTLSNLVSWQKLMNYLIYNVVKLIPCPGSVWYESEWQVGMICVIFTYWYFCVLNSQHGNPLQFYASCYLYWGSATKKFGQFTGWRKIKAMQAYNMYGPAISWKYGICFICCLFRCGLCRCGLQYYLFFLSLSCQSDTCFLWIFCVLNYAI